MKKWIFGMAALAAAMCFGATTEDGVTKERRGALGPNDMVVTDVDATGIVAARTYTKDEVDRRIATNAPVRSVNGKTGRVVLGANDVGALPNNRDGLKANANFRNAVWDVQIKGGGGDVDTNAVRDIIHETVDGAARTLPKYLHLYNADSSYPDEAQEYYRSRGGGKVSGGCSAVRDGNFVYRNFDYPFDERAEFVVRMSAGPNRFASVGVAQVGTNLTEAIVTSGKPSHWYKALPGATVDGINERGVVAEINVVDGDPATSGWYTNVTSDAIHPLAAIRHILDHATNAQHAAIYIAANIRFPQGWEQNFHYMIADATSTYIVENGSAHAITNDVPTLTNFRLYPTPSDGEGQERYDLLLGGANITNVWYTNAYRRETNPPWVSDLADVLAYTNEIFNAWAAHPKEYFRNSSLIPHTSSLTWWQTVHTSVYDLTNRTLRVAVQETDDWYVFQVPASDAKLAEKRDKTDLAVYEASYSHWTWTSSDNIRQAWLDAANNSDLDGPQYEPGSGWSSWSFMGIDYVHPTRGNPDDLELNTIVEFDDEPGVEYHVKATRHVTGTVPTSDSLAKESQLAGKMDKSDVVDPASATVTGKAADALKTKEAIAKKADEFTRFTWTSDDPDCPDGWLAAANAPNAPQPTHNSAGWEFDLSGYHSVGSSPIDEDALSVSLTLVENSGPNSFTATATRRRVLRTGEAATPQELTNAISTNNPAFVSAVRNTPAPEPGQGEDPPWGTWGTVGAAIAGLVSGLAWVKNKIGVIFDNEGEIQNDFATDLLGKQVAIQKIDERLPIPISEKNAGFTTESYKRFVVTVGGNMTVTLHTPTAKQGGGYDAEVFECRFDGASLAADASIAFDGATATTMDTNCGTVTAGKVALMSAFWNGATWDVNWKVEG